MTAREEGIRELALPDIERRVANTVRFGTVMAVNHEMRRIKVKSGEIETTWLPWSAGRAAEGKRRWDAPEVGEQVIVLSPTGDLRQAAVIPGFYQDTYDSPSSDPNKDKAEYNDGTVIEYDRGSHTLIADLGDSRIRADRTEVFLQVGAVSISITASGVSITGNLTVNGIGGAANISMTGNVNIQGDVATTGALSNNGKNVGSTHTHSGVQPGGGITGAPV